MIAECYSQHMHLNVYVYYISLTSYTGNFSYSTLLEKMMITLKNHHNYTMLSAKNLFSHNLAAIQHNSFGFSVKLLCLELFI